MAVTIICEYCGNESEKETGAVNRARSKGMPLYCDRKCAGLGRRKNKTRAQKVAEKREYDKKYRAINSAKIKAKKAAYFKKTYDPAKAAVERKKNMHKHVEYCRRPEYKEWKKRYDRQYVAKQNYGEFWECQVLALDIRDECLKRASDYEIRLANETLNKSQRRKRNDNKTNSSKFKERSLGYLGTG